MNIIGYMNKLNAFGKYLLLTVLAFNLVSIVSAQDPGAANLASALNILCNNARTFLGATAMILVVLAGATYAVGQVLGAETRARAAVWATAMMTGAVIGIVIYIIMPPIISALMGTAAGADVCSVTVS
ncbi:hypothetical protein L0Y65_02805 [Candidatus Micrarchaeota archaeon]|nr:hypothetical protein [Candidatus Micrarchaeota archaeon]